MGERFIGGDNRVKLDKGEIMDTLTKNAERMEMLMCRTANSDSNGWQYIYWLAVAIYHCIVRIKKIEAKMKQGD